MNKPLEGLFVVELTTYWAAPSAGEFLRCLGARVVKIETGKAGDSVRYWGRTCGMPIEANENPSFDLFNGGKEFMHMDLDDPDVRLRLMISFKILEMTGRIPHWETPHGENDTGNSGIVHQE